MQRSAFARRKQVRIAETRLDITEKLQHARDEKAILHEKIKTESSVDQPLIMSACTLSEQDLTLFGRLLAGDDYKDDDVTSLRAQSLQAPLPISGRTKKRLEDAAGADPVQIEMPEWAKCVIRNRDGFDGAVFIVQPVDGERTFWKYIYAVQSPHYLALCQLRELPHFHSEERVTSDNWSDINAAFIRNVFHCNYAAHATAADVPYVGAEQVRVILDVELVGGTKVIGRQREVPLLTYLSQLPEKPVGEGSSGGQRRSKSESLIDQFPWLLDYQNKLDFCRTSVDERKKRAKSKQLEDEADLGSADEDDVATAMDALHTARADILAACDGDCEDFKVRVLGCRWLFLHSGKPFDAVQGYCVSHDAEEFCVRRLGVKTARFTVTYGIRACTTLARGWSHKLQHFFTLEVASGIGHAFVITEAHRRSYNEPADFTALAETSGVVELIARVNQIRGFFA
jgi:hypothetical protein